MRIQNNNIILPKVRISNQKKYFEVIRNSQVVKNIEKVTKSKLPGNLYTWEK